MLTNGAMQYVTFWETAKLFSRMAALFYILTEMY